MRTEPEVVLRPRTGSKTPLMTGTPGGSKGRFHRLVDKRNTRAEISGSSDLGELDVIKEGGHDRPVE